MARKGYLLNADEGDGGTEDFIHTPFFALVDKERHIRGFYDGTDTAEVNRLEQEILLLYRENAYRIKNN
jgi:protein SCO1/2